MLRHFNKMAPFLHSEHTYPLPLCIPTPPPESMLYLDLHVFLLRLQPKEVAIEVIPLLSLQTKIVSTILVFINLYCSFLILHTLSALKVLLNYEVERLYLEVDNTSLPNLYNDMQNWSTCNASCSDSTYIVNYLVHYLET